MFKVWSIDNAKPVGDPLPYRRAMRAAAVMGDRYSVVRV